MPESLTALPAFDGLFPSREWMNRPRRGIYAAPPVGGFFENCVPPASGAILRVPCLEPLSLILAAPCGADVSRMRSLLSIRSHAPSVGVVSVAFVLALASVAGVATLQGRVSSSRDAQVELGQVQRAIWMCRDMPSM